MTINDRKYLIIKKISQVHENWLIKSIEKLLSDIQIDPELDNKQFDYNYYVGNIEDSVDLEQIKKERPLQKLDKKEFNRLADEIEWNKNIEELLNDLG